MKMKSSKLDNVRPHPGPMASQARHESVSPQELCASRNMVPQEREKFCTTSCYPDKVVAGCRRAKGFNIAKSMSKLCVSLCIYFLTWGPECGRVRTAAWGAAILRPAFAPDCRRGRWFFDI